MTPAGSQPDAAGSFSPCVCSAACSAASCSAFLKQSYRRGELCFAGKLAANYQRHTHFTLCFGSLRRTRVGGLLQASVRRTRARVEVSGPLHAPGGHLQRKTPQPRERPGALPMERLPAQQPQQRHETRCDRVHPPLPAPRPACRLRKDSPLRISRQPEPPPGAGSVQAASPLHCCRTSVLVRGTTTVCTQPLMPTVPMRNPARHRALSGHEPLAPASASLPNSTLLEKAMLIHISTRLLPPRRLNPPSQICASNRARRFINRSQHPDSCVAEHKASPTMSLALRSSRDPKLSSPQSSIQSPYIHRTSGLAQIAVSTPLRAQSSRQTENSACGALSIRH